MSGVKQEFWHKYKHFLVSIIFFYRIVWVGIFYLNAMYFFPKFFNKQKYTLFVTAILLCFIIPFIFDLAVVKLLLPGFPYRIQNFITFNIIPIFFILIASSAFRLIIDRIESDKKNKDTLNENLKTELSLLRSQVSPHFMFNVLNNMVALARKKSDQLEPSLIKLSQLLRYMLYETEHKVSLEKEVEYLRSYIDLQQQRFGNLVKVHQQFDIKDGSLEIEPMLLIPFVENAFKHGTVMQTNPEIHIVLHQHDHQINLMVKNKFINTDEIKDATKGIGLENVQRRLQLLYPEQHQLSIINQDNWYVVHLKIQI